MYLLELDPRAGYTWREHIQHVLIFCTIHYHRNVRPFRHHPAYQLMRDLPSMSSREKVYKFLEEWKNDIEIGGWVKHKSSLWV